MLFVILVCVCVAVVSQGAPDFVMGVKPFMPLARNASNGKDLFASASCSTYTWNACPDGYGISSATSTNYIDCCDTASTYYCPTVGNQCTVAGSCCQTNFPIFCSVGSKTWCCGTAYPICGTDGSCYSGSCSCGGGCNPDPCQYQSCGTTCSSCCANYAGLCTGPATCTSSRGAVGVPNKAATVKCSGLPPPSYKPSLRPSFDPTSAPIANPTAVPTPVPTVIPTAKPTAPTADPTAVPTAPTANPTAIPTAPTPVPTTALPSAEPTYAPTAIPTTQAPVAASALGGKKGKQFMDTDGFYALISCIASMLAIGGYMLKSWRSCCAPSPPNSPNTSSRSGTEMLSRRV